MEDKRNYCVIKKTIVNVGDVIDVGQGFFDSQSVTKEGKYRLEKVPIDKIDVFIKKIANRDYFYWEDKSHLDSIKRNFNKTGPVILEEFQGKYYSVDGHHRITIALELGLTNILSFVTKVDKLSYIRK